MADRSEETASPEPSAHDTLPQALASCEIELPADRVERLDAYRRELWAWNERLNLTRHTTLEKFVTRDVVDTLQLSELIGEGERVLDIGSGGGVPGAPLAILRPDLDLSLSESVVKKAQALSAIVETVGLSTPVYAARAEHVLETEAFDTLIARAVAPLWKFLLWLKPHPDRFRRLLLIKGPAWVEERGEARHRGHAKPFDLRRAAEYTTPRTTAVSTILSITPADQ